MGADGPRLGRRLSRALSRGGADGHGGRRRAARPASLSMWLLAVTRSPAPRYSKSISAGGPSNGAEDSFTVQDHSQGRACGASVLRTADP